jgi:hypothetical protein
MATRTALTSTRLRRHDLIGYSLTRIFRDGDGQPENIWRDSSRHPARPFRQFALEAKTCMV